MRRGFTLVEIMIVVAIIALLAAIAIPNLLRARVSAQESAAASAMHTIVTAQTQWRASHSSYANLTDLDSETPPYIELALANGTKQGYIFATGGVTATDFYTTGIPQTLSQARSYYIDEAGTLCRSNAVNTAAAAAHAAVGSSCPANYSPLD